jgi:nitrite reductase/ring-hydroxylating ferredoxin subunit
MRVLCRLDDIPDGAARGFGPAPGGFTGLFAVRRGDAVHLYVNACPHVGVSLDWAPDRFLTADGAQIVCSTHGALFDIETGRCTDGPCVGDSLEKIVATIENGEVLAPDDAGL